MHFTPRDVDQMTVWEFECCFDGVAAANGAKPKAPELSDERMAELGIEGF